MPMTWSDGLPAGSAARLTALAGRYGLSDRALARLRALVELLIDDPLAPTAIRDPDRVIDDHLADSLVALELEPVRRARQAVDLGSGAGLPGLALAAALPEAQFVLLESAARKCAFLTQAAGVCRIPNVEVIHERAESWRAGLGSNDLVTARALAPLAVVAEYAAPLLRVGGALVAWRGRRDPEAEAAAARAAVELGLASGDIRPVHPYDGADNRNLYLTFKVMQTPSGFPRRPGMALKRPLGSPPAAPDASSDRVRR